jgi:hypothetical protein
MEESRFCYAKEGGQGFVHKSKCTCDKKNNPCQAIKDSDRFHEAFKGIAYEDLPKYRKEIIDKIKPEFKDSQWYKDNVVE